MPGPETVIEPAGRVSVSPSTITPSATPSWIAPTAMLKPTPQSGLASPAVEVSSWREPVATSTAQMPSLPSLSATAMRDPSGDHDGAASVTAFVVRRCCPVPSAFIAYSSALPSRVEMNAIRAPSGDHVGFVFAPPLCERSVGVPPPAGTVKTSEPSSKAIVAPFGENTGLLPVAIAAERPLPSALIVLISPAPLRKTSFVPSGDHEGVVPAAPVSTAPEPSSAIVRIVPPATYATRSPSGETDGCDPCDERRRARARTRDRPERAAAVEDDGAVGARERRRAAR